MRFFWAGVWSGVCVLTLPHVLTHEQRLEISAVAADQIPEIVIGQVEMDYAVIMSTNHL